MRGKTVIGSFTYDYQLLDLSDDVSVSTLPFLCSFICDDTKIDWSLFTLFQL